MSRLSPGAPEAFLSHRHREGAVTSFFFLFPVKQPLEISAIKMSSQSERRFETGCRAVTLGLQGPDLSSASL